MYIFAGTEPTPRKTHGIRVTQELHDQLQKALGAAYTITTELGGGGMSRVFVARETALDRDVVIKVLPPELAGELSAERFRRDIQLAAKLQHPHIVPVLAAGAVAIAGDDSAERTVLYYTMPFIDGENLRTKLRRMQSNREFQRLIAPRDD